MDETGQNVQIFEVLFFKLRTTEKQKNKQLIQLILCQLDVRRLAEGKGHETDWRDKDVEQRNVTGCVSQNDVKHNPIGVYLGQVPIFFLRLKIRAVNNDYKNKPAAITSTCINKRFILTKSSRCKFGTSKPKSTSKENIKQSTCSRLLDVSFIFRLSTDNFKLVWLKKWAFGHTRFSGQNRNPLVPLIIH